MKPTIALAGVLIIVLGIVLLTHTVEHSGCETVRSDGSLTTQCGTLTFQPYFWPGALIAAGGIFALFMGLDMQNTKGNDGFG